MVVCRHERLLVLVPRAMATDEGMGPATSWMSIHRWSRTCMVVDNMQACRGVPVLKLKDPSFMLIEFKYQARSLKRVVLQCIASKAQAHMT